jgi:hypothetical protein
MCVSSTGAVQEDTVLEILREAPFPPTTIGYSRFKRRSHDEEGDKRAIDLP